MQDNYIQDQIFDRNSPALKKGEYENCIFNSCVLDNIDLSDIKFVDCSFNDCNLSLANLTNTLLRDISFRGCKMLGLRFDSCNAFGLSFSFQDCQLNHASFYKTKIKKTVFKNCALNETDFVEADLTSAVFEHCNLSQAAFDRTILEKADFRTSYNYSIDPSINRVKRAKFSISGLPGLLDKYDIDIED